VEEKCENLTALSKVHQLNSKKNEDLLEKQSVMYKTLLDEMNDEKKQQRNEMEKVIKDEREVSARLMSKTQELNSTISKLSADHFLLKEAQYMQNGKMQKLEQIVASGEVKLRTMTGNYCQMQNEMETLLRKEAETKRRLHETKIALMKATTQQT
jgi:septal ring factor EnvC (AmiA/AmiB activator)